MIEFCISFQSLCSCLTLRWSFDHLSWVYFCFFCFSFRIYGFILFIGHFRPFKFCLRAGCYSSCSVVSLVFFATWAFQGTLAGFRPIVLTTCIHIILMSSARSRWCMILWWILTWLSPVQLIPSLVLFRLLVLWLLFFLWLPSSWRGWVWRKYTFDRRRFLCPSAVLLICCPIMMSLIDALVKWVLI